MLFITLYGIYPKDLKTYVYTKTSTETFIMALFTIAKIWKQPKCSSGGEWINKMWYIQTTEYYSVLKKK